MFLEEQLPIIAGMQTLAQFGPLYFLLKLAILFAEENVFIVTTCALFWLVDRKIAVKALLLVLASEYLNFLLKWSVHQPRPYWISEAILPLSRQPDFGFPTAYPQDALVYWTYLAFALNAKFNTKRFWILPATIVPTVSLAVVMLGANFIHDALAGLVLGALVLVAARYLSRFGQVLERRPWLPGFALLLAAPLMNALLILRAATIGPVQIPGLWRQLALRGTDLPPYLVFSPWNVNMMIGLCAAIFAVGLYLLLARRPWFAELRSANDARAVVARLFLGLVGLVAVKAAMASALLNARDMQVALIFGFGYFGLACWALIGAPLLHNFLESRGWFRSLILIGTSRQEATR